MRNLYWNQEASTRYNNDCSRFYQIKRGLSQRCVMSSDLFNLYSEGILHYGTLAVRGWSRASESDLCVRGLGSIPDGDQLRAV